MMCKKRLFPFEERSSTRLATNLDPRFKKEGFRSHFNAEQAVSLLEKTISSLPHTNKEPILPLMFIYERYNRDSIEV